MTETGYLKKFYAKDLYPANAIENRFEFLCFLYQSKDVALIKGYIRMMKIVFDKHPYMLMVLEKAINVITNGNVIGKLTQTGYGKEDNVKKHFDKTYHSDVVSFED